MQDNFKKARCGGRLERHELRAGFLGKEVSSGVIENADQKARVMNILMKRDPAHYESCAKKCPFFEIVEIGCGQMMYFCNTHEFKDMCVV